LIVDEAHNLLNLDNLVNLIQKFNKVLLVTSTPPTKMEKNIPHEIIYKYSFSTVCLFIEIILRFSFFIT